MKTFTHKHPYKKIATRTVSIITILSFLLVNVTIFAIADDGPMFRKNVSNTPEYETEFASIRMLPLYVPPQSSDGTLLGSVDILNSDNTVVETREYVQPLIVHYTDGPVTMIEEEGYGGFPGHGKRDAYGAVSLDGGSTWKKTNLSKSGDLSSIKIKDGKRWVPYFGDVGRTFVSSDGNQVLVTWVSKYCGGGSPASAMTDAERVLLAPYLAEEGLIADSAACTDGDPLTPCTYLEDSFGVSGSQGVQPAADLAEDGYPLVGDYPFSCTWSARGVMLPPVDESGLSTFTWFKAERLTSGVRSTNRPETVCVKGAGCVITWQEDPEGIRPGEGEGPGEGWSGAVAHHETDTWYTYISWEDFSKVSGDGTYGSFYDTTGDLATWVAANPTGSPKAAVPMSIPMRLTDNAMCTADDSKPYCFVDYDGSGVADFCASTVSVTIETPEGPTQDVEMCVTEDGRLMRGNTAATRARLGLHGYSTLGVFDKTQPDLYPIYSAWFYMSYEENKGLGDICDDGDCDVLTDADKRDMGKNVWYHTFDMFKPELISQGLMMNQPAVYPDDWSDPTGLLDQDTSFGYNFWHFTEDPIYATLAGLDTTTLYQSEISRRPSVISQDWYDAGSTGTVAFQLWKQGIIRRGGPADIMGRRFVMPPVEDGECENEYELCTTEYQQSTTTYEYTTTSYQYASTEYQEFKTLYEYLTITQDCHIEQVWVPYLPNPDYNYSTRVCKKTPDALQCFPYLDPAGNPTKESGAYVVQEVCEDVETWEPVETCNVEDPNCRTSEEWVTVEFCEESETCKVPVTEIVDFCDVSDPNCTGTITTVPVDGCDVSDPNCIETITTAPVESCDVVDPTCQAKTTCGPVESCDVSDPNCSVTEVCEVGIDYLANPYDYTNMVCENADGSSGWAFTDGANPRYVKGLCTAPAVNLSGNTILTGETCADATSCLDAFPFNDYYDDLEGGLPISKILTWQMYGPGYGEESLDTTFSDDPETGIDDTTWANPYDMAKGHRGFLAGDMVMAMYGWTNNWQALTDANDIVNLYVRRSFDGGQTWSTLPASFTHTNEITYSGDGTTTCEWMGPTGSETEYPVCVAYGAGEFEQARNVSQLLGTKVTVLDPRYSPTTRSITDAWVSTTSLPDGFIAPLYEDDTRDPSRYFMVYETGHSSAYDSGEAPPLDLFYSRAVDWGDDYLVWQDEADTSVCLPSAKDTELTGFCNEFDAIEGSQLLESGEASVTCSPGGQFFYAAWNQWDFTKDGIEVGADAWFRRILFLDDYIPPL